MHQKAGKFSLNSNDEIMIYTVDSDSLLPATVLFLK